MMAELLTVVHHPYPLHWLSHILGLDNLSGPFYGLWSGPVSDIEQLTLLGGVAMAWHHLNCHEPKCKRVGRYTLMTPDGQHHRICKRHHPDQRIKHATHSITHIWGEHGSR